jgi:hypothetical protein
MRRLHCLDRLPRVSVFMHGPRWRRTFDVREVALALPRVDGDRRVRRVLVYDFEADVRERILEELRPGVDSMWVDVYERLGMVRPGVVRQGPARVGLPR